MVGSIEGFPPSLPLSLILYWMGREVARLEEEEKEGSGKVERDGKEVRAREMKEKQIDSNRGRERETEN